MTPRPDHEIQELLDAAPSPREARALPAWSEEDRAELAAYRLVAESLAEPDFDPLPADFADAVVRRAMPPERFAVYERVVFPLLLVSFALLSLPIVLPALGEALGAVGRMLAAYWRPARLDLVATVVASLLLVVAADRMMGRRIAARR